MEFSGIFPGAAQATNAKLRRAGRHLRLTADPSDRAHQPALDSARGLQDKHARMNEPTGLWRGCVGMTSRRGREASSISNRQSSSISSSPGPRHATQGTWKPSSPATNAACRPRRAGASRPLAGFRDGVRISLLPCRNFPLDSPAPAFMLNITNLSAPAYEKHEEKQAAALGVHFG